MKDIERMVVSAREDGEVGPPWNDQVLRKIAEDPGWAGEAELHRRVKSTLAAAPVPDFSEAQTRVWDRLQAQLPRKNHSSHGSFVWGALAAAALLVLATGTGYWFGRLAPGSGAQGNDVAELQVQVPKQLELKLSGEGQLMMASTLQGNGR